MNLDLNLLAAFEAMYREGHVTRAAKRLGITQPAMSNALRRLRDMLDDPLFVRAADGMAPTPRALALGPQVEAALMLLREAIGVTGFEAHSSAACFTLGTLDWIEAIYLPRLIGGMERAGKSIGLRVKRLESIFEIPRQALETGLYDCALGLFPWPLPPQLPLLGQVLGQEDWVCIARKGHPAAGKSLSLADYAALPHLGISYPGTGEGGLIDRLLDEKGLSRRCVAILPHFMTLARHVAASDCVATLPRTLASLAMRELEVESLDIPPFAPPVNVSLIWHQRVDKDPAQAWFRVRIAECMAATA